MTAEIIRQIDEPHIAIFPTWPEGSDDMDGLTLQIGAHDLSALNSLDVMATVLLAASTILRQHGFTIIASAVEKVVNLQLAASADLDQLDEGIIPGGSDV